MIFGDFRQAAIEVLDVSIETNGRRYGRIVFWITGVPFHNVCAEPDQLHPFADTLEAIREVVGRREDWGYWERDSFALLKQLYLSIYTPTPSDIPTKVAEEILVFPNGSESFDNTLIAVISNGRAVKIAGIYSYIDVDSPLCAMKPVSVTVPMADFVEIVDQAIEWIRSIE